MVVGRKCNLSKGVKNMLLEKLRDTMIPNPGQLVLAFWEGALFPMKAYLLLDSRWEFPTCKIYAACQE